MKQMNHINKNTYASSTSLVLLLCLAVLAISSYASLPHIVGSRALLAFVPPFREGWDANMIDHLGGEYLHIARSLAAGDEFGSPFGEQTGPTAWMPPVYPLLLAGLLWAFDDTDAVAMCVVMLQNLSLIFTGLVVLDAARRTTDRPRGPTIALAIYVGLMLYHFHSCFQFTHDSWLVMLCLSLLFHFAGKRPGRQPSPSSALLWGAGGGVAALISPILGLVWAAITAIPARRVRPLAWSLLAAAVVAAPWMARNYWVFHRFIPVKSNLYYELYQSSCLEPSGVLRLATFGEHPYNTEGPEHAAYEARGEIAYLDDYRQRFLAYLGEEPLDYAAKVGNRLLAATVVYFPFDGNESGFSLWLSYALHPLPFYGLVAMVLVEGGRLSPRKKLAILMYCTYLLPYVLISYYERYAMPLLGLQALFCSWGLDAIARRPYRDSPS